MYFYQSAVISTNVIGVWDTYLLWRQRQSYKQDKVPEALKAIVSPEEFVKNQRYGLDLTSFKIIEHVTDLVSSNIGLLCNVPARLYSWTAAVTGLAQGTFKHCFAFSVASDVVSMLFELPVSYYHHFVVEEKHGFNKMTRKEFFLDALKSFGLRVALLHPIVTYLIQWVVKTFGDAFPLYFFGAATAMIIAFTFIFPTFIQPLFNKFSILDPSCQLHKKIEQLSTRVGFPLTKVFTVDGSRRSNHSNAYFYGMWKNKRIVLFDTLIEQLGDDDERIVAVLSHELGHWKLGHIYYNLSIGLTQLLAFSYGAKTVLFNEDMYRQFGFGTPDPVVGFSLFSQVFMQPLSTLFGYGMSYLSRTFEFQADRFAVSLGYGSKLRDALIVMTKENKSGLTPDPLYSALTYSHPPVVERLAAIEKAESTGGAKKMD